MTQTPIFPDARILVVDDSEANVRVLERLLKQEGYAEVHSTTRSQEVIDLFAEVQPDLLVLDLHMPFPDGYALLEHVNNRTPRDVYLPILILTGDLSPEAKNRALVLGAKDFLTKPFSSLEARYRIRNLLQTRRLHLDLQEQNATLERQVEERTRDLEQAHLEVLERLASAAEFRDDETGQHTQRVGDLAAEIAEAIGLPPERVELIRRAAPLHDVGKIGIPDGILLKPGKLTDEEFETIKTHTTIGAKLLANGRSESVQLAEKIALGHHERWDGTGYPSGLSGTDIPQVARIVALADFYDALTSDRPYREAWPVERVLEEIRAQSGRHFDPQLVEALLKLAGEGRLARRRALHGAATVAVTSSS